MGVVTLSLRIAQLSLSHRFFVINGDNYPGDLLFGCEFMRRFDITLQWVNGKGCVYWKEVTLPADDDVNGESAVNANSLQDNVSKQGLQERLQLTPNEVYVANRVTIPSYSKREVVVTIPRTHRQLPSVVVEARDFKKGLYVNGSVTSGNKSVGTVEVINMTEEAINLGPSDNIGSVCAVEGEYFNLGERGKPFTDPPQGVSRSRLLEDKIRALDISHLNLSQKRGLLKVIRRHDQLFAVHDLDLGKITGVYHHIDTGNASPSKT